MQLKKAAAMQRPFFPLKRLLKNGLFLFVYLPHESAAHKLYRIKLAL